MNKVFHGGRLDAAIEKYGGDREEWIDLSTGINPISYPLPEIPVLAWERLPDEKAEQQLIDAAREYYQVPESFEIVPAPGTQAIIELLPRILGVKTVSIVSPTYAEHQHAWQKAGVEVVTAATPENECGVLVVVNPNNPTAKIWSRIDLHAASNTAGSVVIDEAFSDTVPGASIVPEMRDNMIVLKSFGKFFGLAGLRLGFAICRSEIASKMRNMIGPWAVSGPALKIGATAFRDLDWISRTNDRLQSDSRSLNNLLKENGLSVEAVNPLFVSAHHASASTIHEFLAKRHILIRPFPEREGYLRFGLCANREAFTRLEQALKAYSDV